MRLVVVGFVIYGFVLFTAHADASLAYSVPGSTYTQDFDSLEKNGDSGTWVNDSTLEVWSMYRATPGNLSAAPVAVTSYSVGDGSGGISAAEGNFFSFGAAANSERALGAVGFGNYAGANGFPFGVSLGWIAASFTNDTGGTLPEFTVGYRGEQWRDAGNGSPDPQEMIFEYGFGSSFATISSWTAPGGLFDWTSPVASDVKKAVDGNTAGLVAGLGGTIGGLNWLDGETLYLRW
jgi:hypothetical protein